MLSWIPLLGPIIQGLVSIFVKQQDVKLAEHQADVSADTEDAKTAANIIETTKDDIGLRILRDMACLPVVVWSMLIGWDTIVAVRYPDWMWHTEKYPDSVSYLPYAVLVFLLGNIGINAWKRK